MLLLLGLLACSGDTLISELEPETQEVVVTGSINLEVFHRVKPVDAADVILVVDSSGSMSDDVPRVKEQIEAIVYDLQSIQGLDWQLGVIVAHEVYGRDFVGFTTLYSGMPNLSSAIDFIIDNLSIGHGGYGESGFGAGYSALLNPSNDFFFRTDSDLFWVFISDEDEQSNITAYEWKHLWDGFKDIPYSVYSSAIVAMSEICGDYGYKYIAVSEEAASMCDEQWDDALLPLQNRIGIDTNMFILEHTPVEGTIRVYVNDKETVLFTVIGNIVILDNKPTEEVYVAISYTYT